MKANILLRVSSKGDSQEERNQEPDCINYCKEKNIQVNEIFYEKGSAFSKEFEEREVFQDCLQNARKSACNLIVVWNIDRYSRLIPEKVIAYTKKLSLFDGIEIKAVHGDAWSGLVESIARIKDNDFIGQVIGEFLEKLIKGLEHQRAYSESKVKSDRIKLAVRKKDGDVTRSYRGKKWGRKSLPKQTRDKILKLKAEGKSIRKIAELVKTYDNHGNAKKISKSVVHKTIQENC